MGAQGVTFRVFVGYDAREDVAFQVCRKSLLQHSSIPLSITPLDSRKLRHAGLLTRDWYLADGQFVDDRDNRPFSTEFAFSRFLVAALCQWEDPALFCDCDFLWRRDVADLAKLFDPKYAVQVVQHDHAPEEGLKMAGQHQGRYFRKNWSSLVLWNCGHASNLLLTPDRVNTERGQWLHSFDWLRPTQIGALPDTWNALDGKCSTPGEVGAVHFTSGGPWHPGYEDCAFADEWREVANALR